MLRKICFLTCHNLYESKQYFTEKLSDAFRKKNILTSIFSWPFGPVPEEIIRQIAQLQPDITCSFHQLPPQPNNGYFWDALKIPHWTILLDPAFYDLELMQSSYSIISCVDRSDCDLLRSYHFNHTFFFPHAVEQELISSPSRNETRDIDVIMLGTCYDPDSLRSFCQSVYPKKIMSVLDEAVESILMDNKTSFLQALMRSLAFNGIDPQEVEFDQLAFYVDSLSRGYDRLCLIRSIRDASIHVFGSTCWRKENAIFDWSHYLSRQSNVTIHPGVSYAEGLKLLKRSKICLNSMPFFKNGSHERIFAALACGSLPLTSDNLWIREQFTDKKEILLYQSSAMHALNDMIHYYLSHSDLPISLVKEGQKKVLAEHTWDVRAEQALSALASIHSSPIFI